MSAKYKVGQVVSVSNSKKYGPFTDKITSVKEYDNSYFYKFENHDGWGRGLHECWISEVVEDVETENRRFKVGDKVTVMHGDASDGNNMNTYEAEIVEVVDRGYYVCSSFTSRFYKDEDRVYSFDYVNTNLEKLEKLFSSYSRRENAGNEYIYFDVNLKDTLNGQYTYDLVIVPEDGDKAKFVSFNNNSFYADFIYEEKVVHTAKFKMV